jgi:serine/threonine protein phosphatase PrpC
MSQFELINESVIFDLGAAMAAEEPRDTYVSLLDSAVHQLGSAQDVAYTNKIETAEYTEWNLAIFDGHGSIRGKNPYTGVYEPHNLTVLALQDMIEKKQMDEILSREIFGEEDSARAMQRALSNICVEKKTSMLHVGATMVHVKVRREFATKKILVDVLSVGDSVALIHQNGKKVLQSVEHTPFNADEIARLIKEKRIVSEETAVSPGMGLEVLDDNTLCSRVGKYITVGGVQLAMTQSIGHIRYSPYGSGISDETGVFGLVPYKVHMEFTESDKLNIKLFSDGVSDMIVPETLIDDQYFMIRSNATNTAEFAKNRWQKEWRATTKTRWNEHISNSMPLEFNLTKIGADDISCVSLILEPSSQVA